MKRSPLAAAVLAALPLLFAGAAQAGPAVVDFYLFDGSTPVSGVELQLDTAPQPPTGDSGGARLEVAPGTHVLRARTPSGVEIDMPLDVADDETLQISAALYPDRPPVYRVVSSVSGESTVDLSQTDSAELAGTVVDATGAPVAGAEVTVNGVTATTDASGAYTLRTRPGTYPLLVAAPGYEFTSLPGTGLAYGDNAVPPVTLAAAAPVAGAGPASSEASTLQGVTVEQAVETDDGGEFELAVERRDTAQVIDTLSIDQISRAGDSDAATALKRVTGLSLVDDKFIYVRGLGERYSSVLLNGAQIPSPDPTRRVVPLDLFPSDILSAIAVQKTYSPDMPGEFGGGTVQLRTRGVPDAFLLRASGTLGYVDGTTGEDGLRSVGGGRDWLGRDDGFRDAPDGLFQRPLPPRGSDALAALGRDIAGKGLGVGRKEIGPDTGFGVSVGNRFGDDDFALGFLSAVRYAQNWDQREEHRREFSTDATGTLTAREDYIRERTERVIDSGLFLAAGADIGSEHHLTATAMQLRQTEAEDAIDEGLRSNGSVQRSTRIEWTENELTTLQLGGEHTLPAAGDLGIFWQYTDSRATRDLPLGRAYRYGQNGAGEFVYTASFPPQVRYEFLDDNADEAQFGLRYPFTLGDERTLTLDLGGSRVRRDRASEIWRYSFRNLVAAPGGEVPIDDIINPGAIDSGTIELIGVSNATDFYTADQSLDALYLNGDLQLGDWRINLGARQEDNTQRVITQNPFLPGTPPVVAGIDGNDLLPSAAITWAYSESAQWRLGYNETVSRPEFRELSTAPYDDPLLDISVVGNPDLVQTDIRSVDLRWEYYFNDLESVSIALFSKQFDNPIELVRTPGSNDLLSLRNADSADSRGIEFDISRSLGYFEEATWLPESWRRSFWQDLSVSANYAWIDSEVDLGDAVGIQTSARRPLQGQSKYLANVALSWFDPEGRGDATLLYNVAGERVTRAGQSGLPDEYEQPFHQLDFTWSRTLPWDGWKAKLRLRNLLDPEAEFTQGGEVSRRYRKGREVAVSVEWKY
ncbi:TonB-dependent receptor [Chiayiivirga flava]|uniref:TonB-dependent receptor n=1 Tax=Chiayiivirga flava TaxID=659595 RepID=A0A7W8D6C6_9GAMM|nr:TonB-dependent receptor [Chiayiivirga flava]MBB5207512.1 hypothetical protein [Chiayiivirga flava]